GGMIVTDHADWAAKAKYLTTQAKDDPVESVHREIGFNYRLTNLAAAMGCAQLETLSARIEAKRRIAAVYERALREIEGLTPMKEAPFARSIFWMYTVLVDEAVFGMSSRDLMLRLRHERIETRPLWQPMHMSPAHQRPGTELR